MRINAKIVLAFVIVSMLVLSISSYMFIQQGKDAIEERTMSLLESVVILKTNQLNGFFERARIELEELSKNRAISDHFSSFHSDSDIIIPGEVQDKLNMSTELEKKLSYAPFNEISIVDMNGVVEVSTQAKNIGKIKSDEEYFIQGKIGTFMSSFYYDPSTQKPIMIVSAPIKDDDNKTISVIAAVINLDEISKIMGENAGIGKYGETYIVNKFHLLLTGSKYIENAEFKRTIHTEGIDYCISGNSGHLHYNNYMGIRVAGTYSWAQEREICTMAEIPESQVYSTLYTLQTYVMLIGIGLILLTVLIGILISRTITGPLLTLRDTAREIGKGNLNIKIDLSHKDEVGEVSSAFVQMANDLNESQKKISAHAMELEENVNRRTADLNEKLKELQENKGAILNMMEDADEANRQLTDAQEKLNKSMSELKKLDVKKDEFISIAAHELKTPLTAIHGFSQLLQNDKVKRDKKGMDNYLKIIDKETKRLSTLVDEILNLSRIDLGTVKMVPETIDINDMIEAIKKEMNIVIREKGLKSSFSVDKGIKIETDREKLTQVLINLINNSVKYTEKGSISVSVSNTRGGILFSVKDTGIGMKKEYFEKIFERFFQIDSTYQRQYGGTGLGLSLVKEYVERMGGKVSVESTFGKGSTFCFTLPIKWTGK